MAVWGLHFIEFPITKLRLTLSMIGTYKNTNKLTPLDHIGLFYSFFPIIILEKCSVCGADRPIASYAAITEIEKQQKEAIKIEKELEQAKQASMEKGKSLSKPKDTMQRTETGGSGWGDDDFDDAENDAEFDDDDWGDDNNNNNDADWSMGSNNGNGNGNDEKDEKKDGFSDDGDWGGLVDSQYTQIDRSVPIKAREFEVLNPYKLHEYMQKILGELSGVLFMEDLGKVATLWYVFYYYVLFFVPCVLFIVPLACIVFFFLFLFFVCLFRCFDFVEL